MILHSNYRLDEKWNEEETSLRMKEIYNRENKFKFKNLFLVNKIKNFLQPNYKMLDAPNDEEYSLQIKKEAGKEESTSDKIIKEDNLTVSQKSTTMQDKTLTKNEKKDCYEQVSFNFNFLSNKKTIKTIVKKISFSIIQIDYGKGDLSYLSNIKPKGLKNLGGCCYMNSTLQCLYHIKEFTDYFLKNKNFIQKRNGLISTGLLDTFEGLSKSNFVDYYSPKKFKDNLIEQNDTFEGNNGNDSGDLILTILSACQEELGKESDAHDMSLDQRQENLIFSDIFHKNLETPSIIIDLFGFYVRVKNICFECGAIYYSIDLDNMIIFNLEQVFKMNAPDITIKYDKRVVSVENCLSTFSFDKSSFCSKGLFCKYCNNIQVNLM
jgi:uncharacterized UBP type Zn finger protein